MLSLIVAIGKNREIGKGGTMPWHLPEDLKYFKETTMGHKMIIGKNTLYSLPKILPGRLHIVLTSSPESLPKDEKIRPATKMEALVDEYSDSKEEVFVCGGGKIYAEFLPFCQKLYLTRVSGSYDADTYFPEINFSKYRLISKSDTKKDEKSGTEFVFEVYEKL
jgi:dihydrofolate reductase